MCALDIAPVKRALKTINGNNCAEVAAQALAVIEMMEGIIVAAAIERRQLRMASIVEPEGESR